MIRSILVFALILGLGPTAGIAAGASETPPEFLREISHFPALEKIQNLESITEKLQFRVHQQPFLLIATIIFLLAILHTFFAVPLTKLSHRVQRRHDAIHHGSAVDRASFKATLLHFLGEIEAIFGIWVLVLLIAMCGFYDLATVKSYMSHVNFTEPLFVVVIMALASTRPIVRLAESWLRFFARCGRETPAAWWLTILIVAPLLGSLITEPGAMTIAALLLAKKFYLLKPSPHLAYATLGLLFVNISVGGVLTHFAAPPVLMVASPWGLTTREMFSHFGDKAVIAILVATTLYYFFFRNELAAMAKRAGDHDGDGIGDMIQTEHPIPLWVTLSHLGFMIWTVVFAHDPPLFIGGFLFFFAFSQGTAHHQNPLKLRGPILVGFFLAGLVIHGGLQGWWLAPIISSLSEWPLFIGATILTSFNDNAAITFLASQVEGLSPHLKYAVLAGAITGGGLTVIANAPNPAGQALLGRFFSEGISPLKLALAALIPTLIVALVMMFFPDHGIDEMFALPQVPATHHP